MNQKEKPMRTFRKLMILVGLVFVLGALGCATVSSNQNSVVKTTSDLLRDLAVVQQGDKTQFDCEFPEGRDYECYNEEECEEYMRGYGAVMLHRFIMKKKRGWYKNVDVQVMPIHLWMDHNSALLLGKIEGEVHPNGKLFMKIWTETYDLECKLLDSGYAEGYAGEKHDSKLEQ